jgi:hypothetical protein
MTLVSYERSGGNQPADDERLTLDADGSFTLTRTVDGTKVGRFAGRLDRPTVDELSAAAEAAAAAGDLDEPPTMHGSAIEIIRTAASSASFPAESTPDGAWGALAKLMRRLLADAPAQPVAAVRLTVSADADAVVLEALGTEPVHLGLASATVDLTLFGADQTWIASHHVDIGGDDDQKVSPGWRLDVPVEHDLELTTDRTVQVTVELDLADDVGFHRTAQLTAVLGRGWR